MDKKTFRIVCAILRDHFNLDELDLVEFTMEYEKLTEQHIPAEWLLLFPGTTETIKVK